jgi:hypothetical protein
MKKLLIPDVLISGEQVTVGTEQTTLVDITIVTIAK